VFDHVTIRVADRAVSERFYDTVLATLGIGKDHSDEVLAEWGEFSLSPTNEDRPVTRSLHIGFRAPSRAEVDEFWLTGTEAGYRDDGRPGLRPQYTEDYYGSFLLDPDGNSAEAVHHRSMGGSGAIDHVWMRVSDVPAAKRFYETVAPYAGFRIGSDTPERAQFLGAGGSFSVVAGRPSEHVHLAFPAGGDATVDEFHRATTAAGFRDNEPPGERPVYHAGYYSAFVLDPDGNNVEVVIHNRGPPVAFRWG
jgi:catechol 2,3-dioxygenase-like lactoylglutathione lyase family enzyme